MSKTPLNENKFSHRSGRFEFTSERCDFKGGVTIHAPQSYTPLEMVSAVADMIGYHARCIWEELNGFSGYDAIVWTIVHPISDGQ